MSTPAIDFSDLGAKPVQASGPSVDFSDLGGTPVGDVRRPRLLLGTFKPLRSRRAYATASRIGPITSERHQVWHRHYRSRIRTQEDGCAGRLQGQPGGSWRFHGLSASGIAAQLKVQPRSHNRDNSGKGQRIWQAEQCRPVQFPVPLSRQKQLRQQESRAVSFDRHP